MVPFPGPSNIIITGWVKAFKNTIPTAILNTRQTRPLVADAHVPLHLTQNYNGQLTIKPLTCAMGKPPAELLASLQLLRRQSPYIDNPLAEAFKICRASFKSVDTFTL